MLHEKIVAELAIIKEKLKSHPEEAEQLLTNLRIQLMTRRTRPRTVQVISIGQRQAQVFPTGRDPSGNVMPTTWHPAFQVLPSIYFEAGIDIDEVWDGEIQNFRPPTPAEQDTIIAANIKRYQQQPIIEFATDSGPEEGIGDELWEHEYPGDLILEEVNIGKLGNNLNVDCCPPDLSQEKYWIKYPVLNLFCDGNTISYWKEIVGEIFHPEISVKKGGSLSYLEPGKKNLGFVKPAIKRIMALPDDCGCELYNDLTAWFKHWASKSVELYDNGAFIEFRSRMKYPGSF